MTNTPTNHLAQHLIESFLASRQMTDALCEPLAIEDYGLQAIAETSPIKWHIAHTSWFYETFLLQPFLAEYQPICADYESLFNSYYNAIGQPFLRPKRHLLSRPTVKDIFEYRQKITDAMVTLLQQTQHQDWSLIQQRTQLGVQHEKQHQELMLTDLKYNFFQNPLYPTYQAAQLSPFPDSSLEWITIEEGVHTCGASSNQFCFDNETPQHSVYLHPAKLATRPVSNGEYLEFIQDGGYQNPLLWLSDGWSWRSQNQIEHPLYWLMTPDGDFNEFTLAGLKTLDLNAPVCHINYYEADAVARWMGYRLPTEFEWEVVSFNQFKKDQSYKTNGLHPVPENNNWFGQVWQWTQSSYLPYPGFEPAIGAIGEYNGKFMCNQMVLRGGSCFSPDHHLRPTYRNFFYPADRWQMSGIRLAKNG